MKGMGASLDLIVALPILAVSFYMIASVFSSSASYLYNSSSVSSSFLNAFARMRLISHFIQFGDLNYSEAAYFASQNSNGSVFIRNFSITGNDTGCPASSVCSITLIKNSAYLMVSRYENTNKP